MRFMTGYRSRPFKREERKICKYYTKHARICLCEKCSEFKEFCPYKKNQEKCECFEEE